MECIELRAALEQLQIRTSHWNPTSHQSLSNFVLGSFVDRHASSTQSAELNESASDGNDLPVTKNKSKRKSDSTAEMEVVNLTDILKFGRIGVRLGLYKSL